MPQRKNSVKSHKQSKARQQHNITIKTELKKTIKSFKAATSENPEEAKKLLGNLYKKLDKAAKRNILPKKTASRRKARFATLLNDSAKKD